MLDFMKKHTVDPQARAHIRDLSERHKIAFMGERRGYWTRRLEASSYPLLFCSTIGDGCQQTHNYCPHQGSSGAQLIHARLDVHLQGVISHGGNKFYMFRTFNNVGKVSTNIAIHSWLYALEKEMEEHGKLQDTVYHQIDGGNENANLITIAIAELLVHRGLTKKVSTTTLGLFLIPVIYLIFPHTSHTIPLQVVLTRLPVGHTHEDIDARFGNLWKNCRGEHLYSPQKQAEAYEGTFGNKNARVIDVYAVADYKTLLEPHVENVARMFKNMKHQQWTQHQIIVEPCKPEERGGSLGLQFPLGVKTRYKAYHQVRCNVLDQYSGMYLNMSRMYLTHFTHRMRFGKFTLRTEFHLSMVTGYFNGKQLK
jgi:hypothetical protein